jgi:P-type Ca2+ transporter type 2B
MLKILCVAAVVSLTLGIAMEGLAEGWIEGFSILLAVMIITVVASGNNYVKEQQFRKLNEAASKKNINVVRNGRTINMSVYDLLVGDLVHIETGEILSVDGVVVQSKRLMTNESSMTGEPDDIKK